MARPEPDRDRKVKQTESRRAAISLLTDALARQRAASLPAGDIAGEDEVRVWSPPASVVRTARLGKWLLPVLGMSPIITFVAVAALTLAGVIPRGSGVPVTCVLGLLLICLCISPVQEKLARLFIRARWILTIASAQTAAENPHYVATDAVGISFQPGKRAVARRWDETLGLITSEWPVWFLYTTERVENIPTAGFTAADVQALAEEIHDRAGLVRASLPEPEMRALVAAVMRERMQNAAAKLQRPAKKTRPFVEATAREFSTHALLYVRPGVDPRSLLTARGAEAPPGTDEGGRMTLTAPVSLLTRKSHVS